MVSQSNGMQRALSTEQIERLQALAALPDDQIDTSDIPEADDEAWENAIPGQFHASTRVVEVTHGQPNQ